MLKKLILALAVTSTKASMKTDEYLFGDDKDAANPGLFKEIKHVRRATREGRLPKELENKATSDKDPEYEAYLKAERARYARS